MKFDTFIKMNTPGEFTKIVNCNCGDFRCKFNKAMILNCKLKEWDDINIKIFVEYHNNNTINNKLIENYINFYKKTIDIYKYIYKNREEYIYEDKNNKKLLKKLLNYEYSSLINIITSKDEYYNEKNIVKKYYIDMSDLYDKLILDEEYFNKLSNIIG